MFGGFACYEIELKGAVLTSDAWQSSPVSKILREQCRAFETEMLADPPKGISSQIPQGFVRHVTFEVTLQSGRSMPKMDVLGKCDAFCRLSFDKQFFESEVIKRSYEPNWNQKFKFSTIVRRSHSARDVPELYLELFDYDSATASDLIGVARVKGESMLNFCTAPSGWTSQGDVVVEKDGEAVIGKDEGRTRHVVVKLLFACHSSFWSPVQDLRQQRLSSTDLYSLQFENQHVRHAQGRGGQDCRRFPAGREKNRLRPPRPHRRPDRACCSRGARRHGSLLAAACGGRRSASR